MESVATVSSPDGSLAVPVTLKEEGRPGYSIALREQPVIAALRPGFLLTDGQKLERHFRPADTSLVPAAVGQAIRFVTGAPDGGAASRQAERA